MRFKEKQYDGPYEVSGVEIDIEGQLLRGLLYFPREKYAQPYPIIIYFHDFLHFFTLHQIVNNLEFLLEMGFSLLVFNFRGYRSSHGEVSLQSQLQDSIKVVEFIQLIGKKHVFNLKNINILAHGFGSYIALLLCSKLNVINKILLISPILDLKPRIDNELFVRTLDYINKFLPGNVHGIENIEAFLKKTRSELEQDDYQLEKGLKEVSYNKIKVIVGTRNKLINISELKVDILDKLPNLELVLIDDMDNNWIEEENLDTLQEEIKSFFSY